MKRSVVNKVCAYMAEGWQVYFRLSDERFFAPKQDGTFVDLESGERMRIDCRACLKLPAVDVEEEALRFVLRHLEVYGECFAAMKERCREEKTAAWKVAELLFEDRLGVPDGWREFYAARLKKARTLFASAVKPLQNIV